MEKENNQVCNLYEEYCNLIGDNIFGNGEFFANRPFVYIVAENNTGAIFFAGVYNGD